MVFYELEGELVLQRLDVDVVEGSGSTSQNSVSPEKQFVNKVRSKRDKQFERNDGVGNGRRTSMSVSCIVLDCPQREPSDQLS